MMMFQSLCQKSVHLAQCLAQKVTKHQICCPYFDSTWGNKPGPDPASSLFAELCT